METPTAALAASPPAYDTPTLSSMTKRKLQLAIGVLFLVIWVISVALVGFLVRHGGYLRSSISAATLLTATLTQSLDLALHPNPSAQRVTAHPPDVRPIRAGQNHA
jgi:hypothetical protein